ncbi:MAG: AsmA-like C-terminal region-containing protein, partial [Opitutales bacterium]
PALLGPIGVAIHHDIRPIIGLSAPTRLSADLTFDPGWQFARATGRVAVQQVDAYHVPIDAGQAEFEFDGRYFVARHAFARIGENFARGSFFNDSATGEHRFLLEGRLRPLVIAPWFGKWWPAFFKDYEFPVVPPDANVDVKGNWHGGGRNTVFVYADSTALVIHGVPFDHARTLMFIRPNFFDGLEVFTTIGSGSARGTFMRQVDANFALISLDLNFDSTLALDVPAQIFGPVVADVLAPYRFASPPTVKLLMHFDGPASPDGEHQLAQITSQSVGAFAFHDFPLSNLSFHAVVHDDEVVLDHVEAGFAGGVSGGSARVWGRNKDRRLGFDYTLRNASLGQAVSTVEAFSAKRKGLPPPVPGKFVQDKANVKLDLAVSAEGLYDDPFSYQGTGNATLDGDALGEVRMLGLLSELLSFTSLHFTTARASFKLEGTRLEFPQINVTGANSAIEAHGNYAFDRHELDFIARVNPFQESTFLPAALLGAVLTPFSSVFEVKLSGQLDKPKWAFVNGPTNFLRNLAKPSHAEPPPAPATPSDYIRR